MFSKDKGVAPDTILVARTPGETRYALCGDGALLAVVHRRNADVQPGAVYHARVRAAVPGMKAVFVDIGEALPGVLPVKTPLAEGAAVVVAVVVPPRPGKGAELSLVDREVPPGGVRPPVLAVPAPDPLTDWCERYGTGIKRIVCQPLSEATRVRALLGAAWEVEAEMTGDLFADEGVDEAIEMALQPEVKLPSGGSLIIEATQALTAIDVNAGSSDPVTANAESVPAVARELRLRNIAGHIVIDIIPAKARGALPRLLTKGLSADPVPAQVAGFTPLGLLELTRRRTDLSLAETLYDQGRLSAASVAYQVLRMASRATGMAGAAGLIVAVAPEVAALLQGPLAAALAEARDVLKAEIRIAARADARREQVDIRPA